MRDFLARLLVEGGHIHTGSFELTGGTSSNLYCNVKGALGDPELSKLIVELMAPLVPSQTTNLVGQGVGGIPLATDLKSYLGIPVSFLRDAPRSHGLKLEIEGTPITPSSRVFIVDDVYMHGNSLRKCFTCVEHAHILGSAVVIARRQPDERHSVESVLTMADIRPYL